MSDNNKKNEFLIRNHFSYQNGYLFVCDDWGPKGIKIELTHPYEESRAVMLPPEKVRECAQWMLQNIKPKKPQKIKTK